MNRRFVVIYLCLATVIYFWAAANGVAPLSLEDFGHVQGYAPTVEQTWMNYETSGDAVRYTGYRSIEAEENGLVVVTCIQHGDYIIHFAANPYAPTDVPLPADVTVHHDRWLPAKVFIQQKMPDVFDVTISFTWKNGKGGTASRDLKTSDSIIYKH